MSKGFGKGGGARKGAVAQRQLLLVLKNRIDEAAAKGAGASRDLARAELRELLNTTNWRTTYVLKNLGVARCRKLQGMAYPVPRQFLFTDEADIARIEAYKEKGR